MTAQETKVVNAVKTTLSSTMASGATSLAVDSASGIPAVPFYICIDPTDPAKREFMLIDQSVVGTTLAMSNVNKRNLSGSAGAVEHASGAEVRISPVMAQLFEDIHDRIDNIAGATTEQIQDVVGDMFSGSESGATVTYDDSGGTIGVVVPGRKLASATVTATQSAIGTSATDVTNGSFAVTVPATGVYLWALVKVKKNASSGYCSIKWFDVTAGAVLTGGFDVTVTIGTGEFGAVTVGGFVSPGAGSRTYKLQAEAENNTMDVLGFNAYITEAA